MTTHITELLSALGVPSSAFTGGTLNVRSPIDGAALGAVHEASAEDMRAAVARAHAAFLDWRNVPAPKRGELVRLFGEELRAHKADLARLVSLEAGKVSSEGEGEVQEMIDICDFAVGLSRQLHGLTIASERPGHRMMEQYLPLGVVGIISAFNFPVAVWAWNSALALVCGDSCVWKPSEKTPADSHRHAGPVRARPGALQRGRRHGARAPVPAAERRRRRRRSDGRPPPGRPGLSHRLHPHGSRRRPACGGALRPLPAGAGRQQRHHRHAQCRPGAGRARHPVRRLRHGRPALHHHAPRHHSREHP